MPRGGTNKWSRKDERMYEHVKDSSRKRGAGASRAKEIAARTVNKHRSEHGRTEAQARQRKGQDGGSGGKTRQELYDMARKRGIAGRSKMDKQQLLRALRK